jgi:hypothetical protein
MSTQYIYSIDNDFPNNVVNTTSLTSEIGESNITVALDYINTDSDYCYIWFKDTLSSGFIDVLDTVISNHSGEDTGNDLPYIKDVNNKLLVHNTTRKPGLKFVWSGEGDHTGNSNYVWGGQNMRYHHKIGDPVLNTMYVDFNVVNNETYIQEGYMFWDGCKLDIFSAHIVPIVTSTVSGSGTYYNLYGGYLIVPAAGDGTIDITSDITQLHGGLVYMPRNEFGVRPQAFWNADWNNATQEYENITAAPNGDGLFNLFASELINPIISHIFRAAKYRRI